MRCDWLQPYKINTAFQCSYTRTAFLAFLHGMKPQSIYTFPSILVSHSFMIGHHPHCFPELLMFCHSLFNNCFHTIFIFIIPLVTITDTWKLSDLWRGAFPIRHLDCRPYSISPPLYKTITRKVASIWSSYLLFANTGNKMHEYCLWNINPCTNLLSCWRCQ